MPTIWKVVSSPEDAEGRGAMGVVLDVLFFFLAGYIFSGIWSSSVSARGRGTSHAQATIRVEISDCIFGVVGQVLLPAGLTRRRNRMAHDENPSEENERILRDAMSSSLRQMEGAVEMCSRELDRATKADLSGYTRSLLLSMEVSFGFLAQTAVDLAHLLRDHDTARRINAAAAALGHHLAMKLGETRES
jgi:hypothetical protein